MTSQIFLFREGRLENYPQGVNGENYQNPYTRPSTTSFTCRDINGDGLLELPIATLLPGIPDDVTPDSTSYLVEWRNFSEDGGIRTVLFALMNPRENYWFQVPSWMRDRISASNNAAQRTTTYTQVVDSLEGDDQLLGAPLFSIRVFPPAGVGEPRPEQRLPDPSPSKGTWSTASQPLTQDEEGQRIIQEVTDNFQLISES